MEVRARVAIYVALVLATLLLAAAVRLGPWAAARLDGGWLAHDGDSHYHLRRAALLLEEGRLPVFDPELAYPEGARVPWPPGYDLLVAGIAALSGGASGAEVATSAVMLSSPALGVLATLLVVLLARRLLHPWAGLYAGLLFAVYPVSVASSAVGLVDHHALEPLLVAGWWLALAAGRAWAAGLLAGLAFFCFPTALLAVAATGAALGAVELAAAGHGRRRSPAEANRALVFNVVAFGCLVPVVLTSGFGATWSLAAPSRLHLFVVGTIALAMLAAEAARRAGRPRWSLPLAASITVVGVLALALLGDLAQLARFSTAGGLWAEVAQQRPVGVTSMATATVAGLLAMACLGTAIEARRGARPALATLALAALPLLLIGTLQMRFLMLAAPLLALVLAGGLAALGRTLVRRVALARGKPLVGQAPVLVLGAVLLLPAGQSFRQRAMAPATIDAVRTLRQLRVLHGDAPRAAVLADWPWGHHVLFHAGLPTVSSPFILSGDVGSTAADRGNVDARRALLAERPRRLYRLMAGRRARYLLLVPDAFDVTRAAASLGRRPPRRSAAQELTDPRTARRWSRLRLLHREGRAWLFVLDATRGEEQAQSISTASPSSSLPSS